MYTIKSIKDTTTGISPIFQSVLVFFPGAKRNTMEVISIDQNHMSNSFQGFSDNCIQNRDKPFKIKINSLIFHEFFHQTCCKGVINTSQLWELAMDPTPKLGLDTTKVKKAPMGL